MADTSSVDYGQDDLEASEAVVSLRARGLHTFDVGKLCARACNCRNLPRQFIDISLSFVAFVELSSWLTAINLLITFVAYLYYYFTVDDHIDDRYTHMGEIVWEEPVPLLEGNVTRIVAEQVRAQLDFDSKNQMFAPSLAIAGLLLIIPLLLYMGYIHIRRDRAADALSQVKVKAVAIHLLTRDAFPRELQRPAVQRQLCALLRTIEDYLTASRHYTTSYRIQPLLAGAQVGGEILDLLHESVAAQKAIARIVQSLSASLSPAWQDARVSGLALEFSRQLAGLMMAVERLVQIKEQRSPSFFRHSMRAYVVVLQPLLTTADWAILGNKTTFLLGAVTAVFWNLFLVGLLNFSLYLEDPFVEDVIDGTSPTEVLSQARWSLSCASKPLPDGSLHPAAAGAAAGLAADGLTVEVRAPSVQGSMGFHEGAVVEPSV